MPIAPDNRLLLCLLLASVLLISSCAGNPAPPPEPVRWIYEAKGSGNERAGRWAPAFAASAPDETYNRIGQPEVRQDDGEDQEIIIDTDNPAVYFMQQSFATDKAVYTNLIYRVHFPEVPYSLIPFNLTAGKNVGLIVVITLNAENLPILVTTVHTCGCYLAIVPTRYLPQDAFPADWKDEPQDVYGERLPPLLDLAGIQSPKILVYLRPGTHRIMDIAVKEANDLSSLPGTIIPMKIEAMDQLDRLPARNGTTSFYATGGIMQGHVKDSVKPWETLLLGPLSMDLFVGSDKAYGPQTGIPFYTSLKFWRRDDSDMRDFARFLHYWGWRL